MRKCDKSVNNKIYKRGVRSSVCNKKLKETFLSARVSVRVVNFIRGRREIQNEKEMRKIE